MRTPKFQHAKLSGWLILSGHEGDDMQHYQEKQVRNAIVKQTMKPQDRYLKFVQWGQEDQLYVGYCPDLFRWGGVCHGRTEEDAFKILCELVQEEVEGLVASGKPLPEANTRAMREAVPA